MILPTLKQKKNGAQAMGNDQTLDRSARAALSPAERQSIIKNMIIEHDRFANAVAAVARFHMPVEGGSPDFGAISILCGDSRTGKTFALKRYASRFSPFKGPGGMIRRVVYIDMPCDCNLRAVVESIADVLNVACAPRKNNEAVVRDVLRALVQQEVQFVMLDEFQEAFDPSRKKVLRETRTLLRKILNLCTLNVCVAGLLGTYRLLAADKQLVGRGLLPHHLLQAYEWDSSVDQKLFRLLCSSIDDRLPFRTESKLGSVFIAQRLYWVTDGVIGRLKEFIFAAACRAMNADADCIEIKFFADAWDERKPLGQNFNPFVDDIGAAPSKEEAAPPPEQIRTKFNDGIFSRK